MEVNDLLNSRIPWMDGWIIIRKPNDPTIGSLTLFQIIRKILSK